MVQQQRPLDGDGHSHTAAVTPPTEAAHPHSPRSFIPWLTPGSALLCCSLPLGLGTYMGYRQSLHEHNSSKPSSASSVKTSSNGGYLGGRANSVVGQLMHPEPPIGSSKNATNAATRAVSSIPPPVLAARALVIGSLLSISATSLLVSGIFFASGCDSLEELMTTWKSWAPRKLREFESSLENTLGIPVGRDRRLGKEEYERDVKGMTEEEELEYVTNKLEGEIQWESDNKDDDANKQ